jgi:hypothetical protein
MMHLSAWTRNHAAFGWSSIEGGFLSLTQFVDRAGRQDRLFALKFRRGEQLN